ncbi:MAG: DsbA family protein [Sphingobium sp.]
MKKSSLLLIPAALLPLALSACGGKDGAASDTPKVSAGEAVPPPAGKAWSDIVSVSDKGGYVMGNPNAALKVAEFGSFTCSHCADFAARSSDELKTMVDTGKLSFEFRPFVRDPLDMTVALLAGCNGPEPYFPLSHQLFANQPALFEKAQAAGEKAYGDAMNQPPATRFVALAQLLGLIDFVKQRGVSEDKAKQCLSDTKQAEALAAHVQEANNSYTITGTPTLLLNGAVVKDVATWDLMREKLKEAGL